MMARLPRGENPFLKVLLTEGEAVQAFWFLLKMMGTEGRAKLRGEMEQCPDAGHGEKALLIRSIIQFEADLEFTQRSKIMVAGPNQAPPDLRGEQDEG